MTVNDIIAVANADTIQIYCREKLLYDSSADAENRLTELNDRIVIRVTPDIAALEICIK